MTTDANRGVPMSVEIIPAAAVLGAEIRGVDLAQPLGGNVFAQIGHAYNEYGVIFFRDQGITPAQQVAFTRRFGEIEFNIFGERWSVPGCPEIVVLSNITDDGKPTGIRRAGEYWHSDMCYTGRAPRGRGTRCRRRCRHFSTQSAPYSIFADASGRWPRPRRRSSATHRSRTRS